MSVEAPGVQASSIEDAVTEDFDGFSTGVFTTLETAIGTITAADGRRFAVVGEDIYGGAGGVGRYLSVGVQSNSSGPALLTTSGGPQSYFGFWWSAADPWNEISFYSEGRMVATFNTAWVLATISQLPDAASYFGNPNDGSVPGQAYAYINVVFTDGAAYDAVAFSNLSPTISGFETDNWSIASVRPSVIPGTIIDGGVTAIVPEPASWVAWVFAGSVGCFALQRRRPDRRPRGSDS